MKVSEMQQFGVDELVAKENELTKELFNLSFQLHTGRLEKTHRLRELKKDIARVKTVLHEKRG
ncbi:MAG TPA: 50S ribosomal protein L29 [Geobacterales bacterium]|jgi:large subunit ribosomal protein L29|nr:50S ribosomal protein L29 [Geobacterales bacterium]